MSAWIDIADELIGTDFSAVLNSKTELCTLMESEGSDKGGGWHNYSIVYHTMFSGMRDTEFSLFELGMGTTNPSIKSNMGPNGKPGASLRAWSRYFPKAKIFGADVDRDIVDGPYDSDRITTHWVDQTDAQAIESLWQAFTDPFEIIIDDGLHEAHANLTFLENSYSRLSPGGVFVIEDILPGDVLELQSALQKFCASNGFEYRMFAIPNPPATGDLIALDNRMAILARK